MHMNRAAEIISSSHNIEVIHGAKSVWIKSIDKIANSAQVIVLGSKEELQVPIDELMETGVSEPFLH